MEGNTICVLADSLSMPVKSFVPKYRDEFEAHVKLGRCPFKTAIGTTGCVICRSLRSTVRKLTLAPT